MGRVHGAGDARNRCGRNLVSKIVTVVYGTAEWMRNQPDAVEGEARMPNQVGVEITGVPNATTLKLQEIAQKYGVNI